MVIVAKNEENRLPSCLAACSFAKEIILVDDESTDRTREIAEAFGARVFKKKMRNWGEQQTFAIKQATQPWLLLLDCDEIINEELADSIRNLAILKWISPMYSEELPVPDDIL